MNRDFIFRGKITQSYDKKLDGTWAFGSLLKMGTVMKIVNDRATYYVVPKTVGQYTGLNDKDHIFCDRS
jgi:hypothetical protein